MQTGLNHIRKKNSNCINPTDAEDEGRKFSQDVRGIEVMRSLGDKEKPHNRLKKYRLCGFDI